MCSHFRKSEGQAVLGRQDASPTPWLTERHGYDPTSLLLFSKPDLHNISNDVNAVQGLKKPLLQLPLLQHFLDILISPSID